MSNTFATLPVMAGDDVPAGPVDPIFNRLLKDHTDDCAGHQSCTPGCSGQLTGSAYAARTQCGGHKRLPGNTH